jgi:phage-related protein
LNSLDEKSRDKIYYNLKKSQFINDNDLFKKLNDNIWEFRTLFKSNAYRLYSFWDKTTAQKTLVLATHGIIKKTQKTPMKEIEKAEEIRQQYFKEKKIKTVNYGQEIKSCFTRFND